MFFCGSELWIKYMYLFVLWGYFGVWIKKEIDLFVFYLGSCKFVVKMLFLNCDD